MNETNDPRTPSLEVELPAGGRLILQTEAEVKLWEQSSDRYVDDYHLTKTNDLVLVGAVLSQQIALYRAQQRLNGMEPETDTSGIPTGRYRKAKVKAGDEAGAQATISKASAEIRALEGALGIDKKAREAGGTHTVGNYIGVLKRAAHEMGVHITDRIKEYERVMMEARWKLRVLENADAEDLRVHNLSPQTFIDWLREELGEIEKKDKQWARTKGKAFIGKL